MQTVRSNQSGFSHLIAIVAVVVVVAVGGIGVYVSRKNVSHAGTCVQYVYSVGVNGSVCVKYIQQLTNWHTQNFGEMGPLAPVLSVDGNYGPKTKAAVMAYQKYAPQIGFTDVVADGVVGPKTWRALCSTGHTANMGGPGIPNDYPLTAARAAGCSI